MKGLKHNWIIGVIFIACFIFMSHVGFADDTCLIETDGGFYTFTAPVVPVSKTTSSNRVYLAFFRPGVENFWAGNVVKFGINEENQIVDALYDPNNPEHSDPESPYNRLALDPNGAIKESAVPYWATIDWADPTKSDYNYILNSDRNIYTYLGSATDLTAAENAFIPTNPNLTPAVLGNPTHTREEIIGYIRGADVFDKDEDNNTQENRAVITGDVQHSEPLVVQYNYPDNSSKTLVYFGSNDGMLHAVLDTETASDGTEVDYGTEAWAFIPPDQLHKLKDIIEGDVHRYYVDSSPKAYFKDVNSNGVIDSGGGDKIILVCGERKGGTSYFALDITDPFAPVFLWRINQYDDAEVGTLELADVTGTFGDGEVLTGSRGGSATVEGVPVGNLLRYELRTSNFTVGEVVTGVTPGATGTIISITNYAPDEIIAELGETWSEPRFGLVKTSDEDDAGTAVFFIGGGYSADNSKGKAVLAVNVFTGAVVKKFSGINGMNYSFASAVTVVNGDRRSDFDGDGVVDPENERKDFVDKVYVGDLGGQMWRIAEFTDIDDDGTPDFPDTDENIMNWTDQAAQILFISDPAHGRKFFYPPSVTLEWGYDLVFMGTGDREDPCNTSSSDRIYSVKDTHASTTLTESDLIDVTDLPTTRPDLDNYHGWFIMLAPGEKVLSEGVVFLKTYYVTTFSPLKGGTLYALNYKTGEAVYESSRVIGESDGLLSKPVVVINKTDQKLLVSASKIKPGEGESGSVGPGILVIEPSAPAANFFYLWWREL